MRVELLGPVRVDGDGDALSPRDRVVLSALAATAPDPATVDRLSHALWGDEAPASRVKVVQGCVSRLRRTLGTQSIVTETGGYVLVLGDADVDVLAFERLVTRGREQLELGEPDRAAATLGEAVGLWRGSAYSELDDWEDGRTERERLATLRAEAEELRIEAVLRAGRPLEAIAPATRAVREAPLREDRWCLLARAQYQAGQRVAALDTLRRARRVIVEQLGLDPGPALAALTEAVLTDDPSLQVPGAPTVADSCPYPGLLPFGESDADSFMGRDEEVATLLRQLERDGLVVLAGPSGSGKSSLVRAGLAVRLRSRGHTVHVVDPSDDVARTVARLATGDVLLVDQVEAVLSGLPDDDARLALLDALADRVLAGPVVLAVRADRLGDLARGRVARLVERGLHLLTPLDGPGIRDAIEGPAAQAGLLVEPGLVDVLVGELEGEPGALPLLSHALRATWERREGRTLTIEGYADAGGVRGAIAQSAEAVHAQLGEDDRDRLRQLLLRLVRPLPDGSLVAVPLPSAVVDEDPDLAAIVDHLVDARLVTVDDATLQLAHEALIRAWPRLRDWLDEDAAGQRLLHHLSDAATTWDVMGRPDSELYRGARLRSALDWRDAARPRLTRREDAFLDAAEALADREQERERARAARTARTNRRLRRSLRLVAALGVLALAAGAIAVERATTAAGSATVADARRLGAQALTAADPDVSLLLAAEAQGLHDSAETRASLLAALTRAPELVRVIRPAGVREIAALAMSADGSTIATYDALNTVRVHERVTGQLRAAPVTYPDGTTADRGAMPGWTGVANGGDIAFHPDGGPVVIGLATLDAAPLRVLDPLRAEETAALEMGSTRSRMRVWQVDWSPDGARLAVLDEVIPLDGTVAATRRRLLVWDQDDLTAPPTTLPLPGAARSFAWVDEETVAVATGGAGAASADVQTTVLAIPSGEVVSTIAGAGAPIAAAASAASTTAVAAAGIRGIVLDPDGATTPLPTMGSAVHAVAASADGALVATGSDDGRILVQTLDGQRVAALRGHAGAVTGLAFTPDGAELVSSGTDGAVLRWALDRRRPLLRTVATSDRRPAADQLDERRPSRVTIAPDGGSVAYVRDTTNELDTYVTTLQFLDARTGRLLDASGSPGVWSATVDWLPSGDLVSLSGARELRQWDPVTAAERSVVVPSRTRLGQAMAVARDAGTIISLFDGSATNPGAVVALDADTLEEQPTTRRPLRGMPDDLRLVPYGRVGIAADQTGGLVAAAASPHHEGLALAQPPSDHLLLIDPATGEVTAALDVGLDILAITFSPAGDRIAIAGREGRVAFVDVATGSLTSLTRSPHDRAVRSIAWLPSGSVVATGGDDGLLGLWDPATGEPLGAAEVASAGDSATVSAHPDGHTVIAATSGGEVLHLDTRLDTWRSVACAVAGRALTEEERVEFLGRADTATVCGATSPG